MIVGWVDTDDLQDPTSEHAEDAAKFASWLLYHLTAEKYPGVRQSTEWYGHQKADCIGGICEEIMDFYELPRTTPTHSMRYLRMRHTPVISIESVEEAGELLDPSQYKISNYTSLVRTDKRCWNLNGGVLVTYNHGVNPPVAGRNAATHLANEFVLAMTDPDECSLPQRLTSITRQGLSYDILDPQQFISEGRTGVYIVDLFIHAANPGGAVKKPKIYSGDIPRGEIYR